MDSDDCSRLVAADCVAPDERNAIDGMTVSRMPPGIVPSKGLPGRGEACCATPAKWAHVKKAQYVTNRGRLRQRGLSVIAVSTLVSILGDESSRMMSTAT